MPKFNLEIDINKEVLDKDEALTILDKIHSRITREILGNGFGGGTGTLKEGYFWTFGTKDVDIENNPDNSCGEHGVI